MFTFIKILRTPKTTTTTAAAAAAATPPPPAAVVTTPTLNADPAIVDIVPIANTTTNTKVKIDTFGSLGKLIVYGGGLDYVIGDELIFTNKPMSFGIGEKNTLNF